MSTSPKHIRNAIRYNSVGLFLTDSPGHKPDSDVLTFLNRVQTATFGMSAVRQDVAQIGSDDYLARKIVSQPRIDLSFQYFLTDGHEEHVMGLNIASGYDPLNGTIHKNIKEDKSAYFLIGEEPFDLVSYYRNYNKFGGTDAAGFGNCFITNYSVSASVGSFATANVSMTCSNMTYSCVGSFEFERELEELASLLNNEDLLDFDFIRLQDRDKGKVNLQDGDQIETVSGVPIPSLDLTGRASIIEGTGYVFDPNIYKSATSAIAPGGITVEVDNLEFGGPIISGDYLGECSRGHANIQSFDLNIPFEREDLYGMESIHVYGRKLKLPQIGSITLELLSSAFNTGNIKPMLCSDREYKIDLLLNNSCTMSCLPSRSKDSFMRFVIDNAKFESYSLNAGVGSRSTVSCNFTFCVGKEHGIFASGSFPNWRDDKCTPSHKHTPHDFDITRVLEDIDNPEDLEVVRVLDELNNVEIDIDRLK